jgi:eukaryotic-like serine/threonine-protein kinase
MIGHSLGPYRVLEQIGAGAMGVVFPARDTRLDREVALKVLPASVLGDEDARRRLLQ